MEEGGRVGHLATLERLVRRLTRPRLVAVDQTSLHTVAVPPEITPFGEELASFRVDDLEPADQASLITAVERAHRLGTARVMVRFRGDDLPTLLNVLDLRADLGVLAYVFSDDTVDDGPDDLLAPMPTDPTPAVETDDGAYVLMTASGTIVEASGHIPGLMENDGTGAPGLSLMSALHPDDTHEALLAFADVLADHGIARRVRARFRTDDDAEWRWIEARLHAHTRDGEVVVSCLVNDVHADERERVAVAERERVLRTLTDALPVGVVATDDVGTIRFANQAFREATGIDPTRHDWLDYVDPEDATELASHMARLGFYGDGLEMDLRFQRPGETDTRTVRVHLQAVRAADGKLTDVVGSVEDVTDRLGERTRLTREAQHDALTGLLNRVGVESELGARLDRFHTAREPLAVLFVDLHDFGRVNDAFGHDQGDEVLIQVGQRLRDQTRETDVVGRFGGDEFVVVAEQTGGPDGALGLAHRMVNAVAAPLRVAGTTLRPHASIGVALSTGPGTRIDTLLREADAAVREAKRRGRDVVWLADRRLRRRVERRARLEQALDGTIDPASFGVSYQPIHDLRTGEIYGAEGAVWWEHAELGRLEADEIEPVAEQSGLIHRLGRWMSSQIAADCAALRREVVTHPAFRLGVHLSAGQLAAPGFSERVIDALADRGVTMDRLVVEIRQGHLLGHHGEVERSIRDLVDAGAQLALDDFGAGAASFEDLYRLPVRFLKLDARVAATLPRSSASRSVIGHVVRMCDDLGITVIANGIAHDVEHQQRAAACLDIGIREGQDTRPRGLLPLTDLQALVRDRRPVTVAA